MWPSVCFSSRLKRVILHPKRDGPKNILREKERKKDISFLRDLLHPKRDGSKNIPRDKSIG